MIEPREFRFCTKCEACWSEPKNKCSNCNADTRTMRTLIEKSAYDQLLKDARELVGLLKSINVQQIVNGKAGQELRATEISEAITAFEKKYRS